MKDLLCIQYTVAYCKYYTLLMSSLQCANANESFCVRKSTNERSPSTLQYDIVDSLCLYRSLYDGSNVLIADHETFRSSQPASEDLNLQLHLLFHFRWNNFVCHWPHVRIVPFTAGPIDLCSLLAQSREDIQVCAVGHWSQHWVLGLLAFWAPLTKTPWKD